jgi:hypothetical protein
MYSISNFITNVYHDLGNPVDFPIFRLSGWFLDQANLGKLNNLIGTQFSGVYNTGQLGQITGYNIEPMMSNDQMAIYKTLFEYEYFKSAARSVAQSAAFSNGGNDWISLREGDSSITRANKNEISKNFRSMANDAKLDLDRSVKMYLKYNAIPEQVAGDDTVGVSNYSTKEWARSPYI